MRPISQHNNNKNKEMSSSSEFNRIRDKMHHDLTNLYDIANMQEEEIKKNMDLLLRENFFLQNKLADLITKTEKIEKDLMYQQEGLEKQRLIKSFFNQEGIRHSQPEVSAHIDTVYGYVAPQTSERLSKLTMRNDNGQVIIPPSLTITALESNNTRSIQPETGMREYYEIEDNEIYKAVDRSKDTFWVHTSSFPEGSGVTEVSGIIHIKLPIDMLNNIHANTLTLNPYPEYSMTIKDIQIKGYGEQWHRLPNYPQEKDSEGNNVPKAIVNSGKLIFSFPKTEIVEVQIMFTQPYWFSNENNRDFVYGFQEIEVENRIYRDNSSEIVTEFNLEGTTKRFYVIDEPEAIPAIGAQQNISNMVEHKLYYNKELTDEFEFGSEILAPIQKIYIKSILTNQGDSIPMIKQINMDYTFQDMNE